MCCFYCPKWLIVLIVDLLYESMRYEKEIWQSLKSFQFHLRILFLLLHSRYHSIWIRVHRNGIQNFSLLTTGLKGLAESAMKASISSTVRGTQVSSSTPSAVTAMSSSMRTCTQQRHVGVSKKGRTDSKHGLETARWQEVHRGQFSQLKREFICAYFLMGWSFHPCHGKGLIIWIFGKFTELNVWNVNWTNP